MEFSTYYYSFLAGGLHTTNYLIDPNRSYHQVIEESGAGSVIYTYGDDLISQTNAQGTHTFGYDGLGSTRILTDSTGTVQNSYGYQAFGELDYQFGTVENSYLFTGEQYDNNVGFYYLRARYYNPEIGRFSQMDTFSGMQFEPLSLHKYLYTHADPINNVDPSGKIPIGRLMAGLRGAAIVARYSVRHMSQKAIGFVRGIFNILKVPGLRTTYMKRVRDLANLAVKLRQQGKTSKEIAVILNKKRLALGRLFKRHTPRFLRERAFKRNLRKYDNKWGPTIKYFRGRGRSWEEIINSASRPSGMIEVFISVFMGGR